MAIEQIDTVSCWFCVCWYDLVDLSWLASDILSLVIPRVSSATKSKLLVFSNRHFDAIDSPAVVSEAQSQ